MIKTRSFSLLNSCKYHLIYIDNNQLVSLFVSLCTDLSKIWIVTCSNNNNQDLYIVSTSNTSVHLYLIYDVLGGFFLYNNYLFANKITSIYQAQLLLQCSKFYVHVCMCIENRVLHTNNAFYFYSYNHYFFIYQIICLPIQLTCNCLM